MGTKFSFWAYGILAICALSLFLVLPAAKLGEGNWAGNFFGFSVFIGSMFILYMFVKLLRR